MVELDGIVYFSHLDLAAKFKKNKKTIYNWVKDFKLNTVKIGNETFIPESELKKLIHNEINRDDSEIIKDDNETNKNKLSF